MESLKSIPNDYLCPITQELLKDPVVAADGQSYEREAITEWLRRGNKRSPFSGDALKHTSLQENHQLKAIVESFEQSLPTIQRREQVKTDLEEAIKLKEKFVEDFLERNASKMIGLEKENEVLRGQVNLKEVIQPLSAIHQLFKFFLFVFYNY